MVVSPPDSLTLGLLHPGQMGATVGAAAAANVARVLFASEGRSVATRERAARAELQDAGTLVELVRESDLLLSVCPPAAAEELAARVGALGFRGLYADANAVAPQTVRRMQALLEAAGAGFVDAGIIGPPARVPGTTRLHASGERAQELAACFANGPLEAVVVRGPAGAASALKMAYAGWTKGSAALLAAVHAAAKAEGVDAELLREWQTSVPGLVERLRGGAAAIAPKAWRFAGEMREIADTLEAVGVPDGFHRAAAEVYERLADLKDAAAPPDADEVAERLRKPR